MSTRPIPASSQRGFSIVELTVVLFLMSVVGLMFFSMFVGTLKSSMQVESRADLNVLGQRTVNELRSEMLQARKVMEAGAVGSSYLAQMNISTPVLSDSKFPVVQTDSIIQPEAGGVSFVGNSLLMARQLEPLSVMIDHDGDGQTPLVEFLIDRYEFQYYYLTERTDRNFNGTGKYLDLVRAQSPAYADYFQLSGFSQDQRQLIHAQIRDDIPFAWDAGQPANNAFYRLATNGNLGLRAGHRMDLSNAISLLPELTGGRITGAMEYTVAMNGQTTSDGQNPLALMTAEDSNFPGGFETMIVGPSGSRKIWARIVLMSEAAGTVRAHSSEIVISNADF